MVYGCIVTVCALDCIRLCARVRLRDLGTWDGVYRTVFESDTDSLGPRPRASPARATSYRLTALPLYPPWCGIPHQDPEHVHLSSLGAPGTDIRVPLGYSEGREVVTSVSAPGHVVFHTR